MGSERQDREFTEHLRQRNALSARIAGQLPDVRCVRPRAELHRAADWRRLGGPWVCGLIRDRGRVYWTARRDYERSS